MKNYVVICLLSFMVSGCVTTPEPSMEHIVDYALNRAVEQYKHMYAVMDSIPEMLPRSVDKNGGLETSDSYFWTSGFYPGTLWYLYEYTGDEQLKEMASRMSDRVEVQKYNKDNHDVGFMIGCSYLNGYRFADKNGNVDYYNEKGLAMKRTLHRKPLAFQRARISSPFGKRRHPILKRTIVHWGVDYAAPSGTAIYAGGDGVVQVAKYNGGYGNYIKIRHNSEYSTAYGHMKSFAKGIRPGVRVKQGQVIGYVGSTGRSTGPHLHYEVVQNGRRVNPLKIKAAAGENLAGNNLTKFKQQVAELKQTYKTMFAQNEAAKMAEK